MAFPGVASLRNVSRLLLKIKETFRKKREKNQNRYIQEYIYIYYTNTLLHLVGEFHLFLESEFTFEGNKPPPGVWYLTPHLTPAHDNSILLILIIRSMCSRNILISCPKTNGFFIRPSTKTLGIPPFFETT